MERKVRRGDTVYVMNPAPSDATSTELLPAAEGNPPTDRLGIPLREPMAKVFAARADFAEAEELFDRLAPVLDRVAQGPAGEAYRLELMGAVNNGQLGYFCPVLRICRSKLVAAEPYCSYCPACRQANPGRAHPRCRSCGGRGWTTRAAFERCRDSDRQRILQYSCASSVPSAAGS
jgi:hypothetical protein